MISPPHTHVRSAVSPQQSIQEEPEHELIGAGLPLLQRLKLLKAKEERLAKECQAKVFCSCNKIRATKATGIVHLNWNDLAVLYYVYCCSCLLFQLQVPSTAQTPSTNASAVISPVAPTTNPVCNWIKTAASTVTATVSTVTNVSASGAKPALRVSFRDRVKALEQTEPKTSSTAQNDMEPKQCDDNVKEQLNPIVAGSSSIISSSKISKPSTIATKDKVRQMIQHLGSCPSTSGGDLSPSSGQMRPWSKLKLATVVSSVGSSYTSLNNSINDGSPVRSQPIKIAKIKPTTSLPSPTVTPEDDPKAIFIGRKQADRRSPTRQLDQLKVVTGDRSSASDSEIKNSEIVQLKAKPTGRPFIDSEPKNYRSVDDLSPEYGGLPFVKKLKILNERQKLAELESVILTTRSCSLDYPDTSTDGDMLEPLIRSHSEGSGMTRPRITTTPAPTLAAIAPLKTPQCLQSPISPESNETLERRHLKSILKKLSEERNTAALTTHTTARTTTAGLTVSSAFSSLQDCRGLLQAPTVEGYVARHSKFMKSVTFNSTLSSPPASAHSAFDTAEVRSQFPILNAQHPSNDIPSVVAATAHTITTAPPCSPLSQSDNSFLIDDSTNRLYTVEHLDGSSPIKYDPLTAEKATDNSILSKKFIKGKYFYCSCIDYRTFLAIVDYKLSSLTFVFDVYQLSTNSTIATLLYCILS